MGNVANTLRLIEILDSTGDVEHQIMGMTGSHVQQLPKCFLGCVFFTYTYRDEVDVCDPKWMSASWKLNDADTDDTLILQFDKFIVVNSDSLNLLKIPYSKSHYITILLPISPQYPRVLYTCHPPRIS